MTVTCNCSIVRDPNPAHKSFGTSTITICSRQLYSTKRLSLFNLAQFCLIQQRNNRQSQSIEPLQYNKPKVWVPYNARKPQSRPTLIIDFSPSHPCSIHTMHSLRFFIHVMYSCNILGIVAFIYGIHSTQQMYDFDIMSVWEFAIMLINWLCGSRFGTVGISNFYCFPLLELI